MRTIIKNKKYDTETAFKISEKWNGYGGNDFKYENEELYMKKTGEFFIFKEGGGLSRFRQFYDNAYIGGRLIKPLSDEEAYAYLEEWNDVTAIEKYFPNLITE